MIANATSGPVILTDLPAREYHARPELSASQIHRIDSRGLSVYRHHLDEPPPATESMELGTVVHSILFGDPAKEILTWSGADRRTKAGKDEYAAAQDRAEAEGKLLVKDIVMADARLIAQSARCDPDAGHILRSKGLREASIFWHSPVLDTACRLRADFIPEDTSLPIIDLKVVASLPDRPHRWAWKAMEFGYDAQQAHYIDGVEAAGLGWRHFWFLLVESSPPYDTMVVDICSPEWIDRANAIRLRAARDLATAQLDGYYPKKYAGVIQVCLPAGCEGGEM